MRLSPPSVVALVVAAVFGAVFGACDEPPAMNASADGRCAPLPRIVGMLGVEHGLLLGPDGVRFRALGANLYYLQQMQAYADDPQAPDASAEAQVQEALDAAVCLGMPIVRTLAFNDSIDRASIRPAPGTLNEEGLRALDRVVAEAKRRGIRLIMVLTNNHEAYGGLPAYARWAGKQPDDFFGDPVMMGYWKDYVSLLVARTNSVTGVRYADEPAIALWEIANELRCPSCRGTTRVADTVAELARHLRSTGARQPIGDGGEGFDDDPARYPGLSNDYVASGVEGDSFTGLLGRPELDLVSYHLYPGSWGLTGSLDPEIWIDRHEALATAAGKVAYLGEFGFMADATTRSFGAGAAARAEQIRGHTYDGWLGRLFDHDGGSVAALWQLIPASRRPAQDDGFGVVISDDTTTTGVLTRWSGRLAPAH